MHSLRGIFIAVLVFFFGLGPVLHVRCSVAYYSPTAGGGSMLDDAGDGLGEPLNVGFEHFCCYNPFTDNLTDHHLWL